MLDTFNLRTGIHLFEIMKMFAIVRSITYLEIHAMGMIPLTALTHSRSPGGRLGHVITPSMANRVSMTNHGVEGGG